MADISQLAEKAARLRALHAGPGMLVLVNAWDAASAKVFEAAGFPAIATTSGGVSQSIGFRDGEQAPVDEMAAAERRIAGAVSVPLTVDFEAGYQLAPEAVAARLLEIGAAGMNLEDSDHHGGQVLVDAEPHAEWLAAVKGAARSAGVDLFLNARVDVFIRKLGSPEEQLAEGLRRARLYRAAGADCIYPIGLTDEATIARLVEAVGSININVRRGGPTLQRMAGLGVRRVSYATSLFRDAMGWLDVAAREILAESGPEWLSQDTNPVNGAGQASLVDQYRASVQAYSTEAQAYWTRITAFVLLNSALLVARSALPPGPSNHWARVAIALMGVVTTLLWAHTAVRAHYTSAFWLGFLRDLEDRLDMRDVGPYRSLYTFYTRLQVTCAGGQELRMPWYARGNVNDSTSAILTAVFLALWIVALVRLA